MVDAAGGADASRQLSGRGAVHAAAGENGAAHDVSAEQRRSGVYFGQAFPVVNAVEVCFRQQDGAANLHAAAQWLRAHPGWYLRTLWYEHRGAYELSQDDGGPRGALWLIAEYGSDDLETVAG